MSRSGALADITASIHPQRLAFAQRLLETTDLPIEHIAGEAGFGSALSLRQHFAESLRTSPSAYRREFRGNDDQIGLVTISQKM